jgi:hypothetical protein
MIRNGVTIKLSPKILSSSDRLLTQIVAKEKNVAPKTTEFEYVSDDECAEEKDLNTIKPKKSSKKNS